MVEPNLLFVSIWQIFIRLYIIWHLLGKLTCYYNINDFVQTLKSKICVDDCYLMYKDSIKQHGSTNNREMCAKETLKCLFLYHSHFPLSMLKIGYDL